VAWIEYEDLKWEIKEKKNKNEIKSKPRKKGKR